MAFSLPNLPYPNDALEPSIDSKTMQIHHGKHHNGYTSKLNASIEGSELENKSIEEILKNMDMNKTVPKAIGWGKNGKSITFKTWILANMIAIAT